MTKRPASTTQRITLRLLDKLIAFCTANSCGIILRINGQEEGYTASELSQVRETISAKEAGRHSTRKGWDSEDNMGWRQRVARKAG